MKHAALYSVFHKRLVKKSLAFLLAAALMLSAAGCSSRTSSHRSGEAGPFVHHDSDHLESSVTGEGESSGEVYQQTSGDNSAAQGSFSSQTLMFYCIGSDLESDYGAASADFAEMIDSGYDQSELNVVICAGGTANWNNSVMTSTNTTMYAVKGNTLEELASTKSQNMGEAKTVTEFMDYAYENYPADSYSLIFWDHGAGSVIGFGADKMHQDDMLTLTELEAGVSSSKLVQSEKLQYVGFDACLMGMIEVAEALSPYAHYLISSEEVEAGEGWNYNALADITENDAFTGDAAGNYYLQEFSSFYESYGTYKPDYSLSCVDLSAMPEVMEGLDGLATSVDSALQQGRYNDIARLRSRVKTFGKVSSFSYFDYIDLYSLCICLSPLFQDETQALQSALDKAIVDNSTNISGAYGLSIYFPYENKEYAEEWVAEYEKNGFSDTYTSFIQDFTQTLEGETLYDMNVAQVTPQQEGNPGTFSIQLSSQQVDSCTSVYASIWQKSEDAYYCWINSQDVTLSDDGTLTSQFGGDIFYVGDTSGHSEPVTATEIERTDDYVKYAIPVFLNMSTSDIKTAYIHVKVDADHPNGVICGAYSEITTDYPDKNVIEIKEGDEVTPFLFGRSIIFTDGQNVAPFDDWETASGIGESFTVTGDFTVDIKPNEDTENDYLCLFRLTDTQGNSYFTNYIEMSPDEIQ